MSILRIRDLRLIVGAVGLSAAGDALLWVLLALQLGETGGAAQGAGLLGAAAGATIALALVAFLVGGTATASRTSSSAR